MARIPATKWKQYEAMAAKLCWEHSEKTGIEFEELMGECHIAYVEAQRSHNPDKGKFSTYFTWKIRGKLRNFTTQFYRQAITNELPRTLEAPGASPEHHARFKEALLKMKKEAQTLASIILNTPMEIVEKAKMKQGRVTIGILRDYVIEKGLMNGATADRAVKEIRHTLRTM